MIDDSLKLEKARKNLMIFTTILLFLTLTEKSVSSFSLIISFELKNANGYIDTYNEIIFYLLTYFFIRFVSIVSDSKEYLTYFDTTMLKSSKESKVIIRKHFSSFNDKDKEGIEKGMNIGSFIRLFLVPLEELFLNKNFSMFMLPLIYFFIAIIYFQIKNETNLLIDILQVINLIGMFYLIIVLMVFKSLKKTVKKEIYTISYSRKLKEKYAKAKALRQKQIRK